VVKLSLYSNSRKHVDNKHKKQDHQLQKPQLPDGKLSEIVKNEDKLEKMYNAFKTAVKRSKSHQIRRILNHVKKEWKHITNDSLPYLKNKLILIIEYAEVRGNLDRNLRDILVDIIRNRIKDPRDAEYFRDLIIEMPAVLVKG